MKKPRKPKPKHKHTPAHAIGRANTHAGSSGNFSRHADAPGWDHLLARNSRKPSRGNPISGFRVAAAAKSAALSYSDDERSALGLLMLPFVIMAFAMGLTQTVKTIHQPDDASLPTVAASPSPKIASGGIRDAVRALPQQQVTVLAPPAAVTSRNISPAEAVRPADAAGFAARPAAAPPAIAGNQTAPLLPPAVSSVESARQSPAPPGLAAAPVPADRIASLAPEHEVGASAAPGLTPPATPAGTDAVPTSAARQPAASSPAAPELVPAEQRLAALIPIPGEAEIASRDAPDAAPEFAAPSRSICEAPPKLAAARALPPIVSGEEPAAFGARLAAAAEQQTADLVIYTDRYRRIAYPMGDVPPLFGVCTDVVIRAYRAVGLDLQALVQQARVGTGDASIDHRRVETLRRFFSARGQSLKPTEFAEDYQPGDIVTYYRPQNRHSKTHIAIVSNTIGASGNPLIIHNRGWGPQIEDGLFVDEITGHYRFSGANLPAARIAGNTGPAGDQSRIPAIPAPAKASVDVIQKSAIGTARPPRAATCKSPQTPAARSCPARTAVIATGALTKAAR